MKSLLAKSAVALALGSALFALPVYAMDPALKKQLDELKDYLDSEVLLQQRVYRIFTNLFNKNNNKKIYFNFIFF
mgnify:CR=1 FL=1